MKFYNSPQTFLVTYEVTDKSGAIIKRAKIRLKNKFNEFEALASLEDYLKSKLPEFFKMKVLSCMNDNSLLAMVERFNKGFKL